MHAKIFDYNAIINPPKEYNINNFLTPLITRGYVFIRNAIQLNISNELYQLKEEKSFDTTKQVMFNNQQNLFNKIKNSNLFQNLKQIKITHIASCFFVRGKKNCKGTFPHIDGFYELYPTGLNNIDFYTVWLPLTDCSLKNSTLCLINPSQKTTFFDKMKSMINKKEENSRELISSLGKKLKDHAQEKIIRPEEISEEWIASNNLKLGDAVIFRGNVIHASTDCEEGYRFSIDIRVCNQYIEAITPELL